MLSQSEDSLLITSRQLREIAGGVSDMTVWRWAKQGVIPQPIKINGRNYWRKQETIARLMEGDSPTPSAA